MLEVNVTTDLCLAFISLQPICQKRYTSPHKLIQWKIVPFQIGDFIYLCVCLIKNNLQKRRFGGWVGTEWCSFVLLSVAVPVGGHFAHWVWAERPSVSLVYRCDPQKSISVDRRNPQSIGDAHKLCYRLLTSSTTAVSINLCECLMCVCMCLCVGHEDWLSVQVGSFGVTVVTVS